MVLVLGGILLSAVPMRKLRPKLALSLIGGSLLTCRLLLALVLMRGQLTLLAWRVVSLSGLLVGWTLRIGLPRRLYVLSKMSGMCIGMSLRLYVLILYLLLGMRSPGLLLMIFGLSGVRTPRLVCFGLSGAGGSTEAGSSAFPGRGLLRIRSRRLGGRAVGRSGASRLQRVGRSGEVDVSSAQHFVDSSLAPVLLSRRRLKSVADVLKGIRNRGFTQARRGGVAEVLGCCLSSMAHVVGSVPYTLAMGGSSQTCMVFTSGSSILLIF